MIRKSLFWGLTLVLVVALVSLIIRGRRLEKQQPVQTVEEVRQSRPSLMRVLHPAELQIVDSAMQLNDHTALHEIEIRNNGNAAYTRIQLEFIYLDEAGKILSAKTQYLGGATVFPGRGYQAENLTVKDVPSSAAKFQVSVLSADLEPATGKAIPDLP